LRLLLDTHIWYWLVTDLGRIGKRTIGKLTDARNELWPDQHLGIVDAQCKRPSAIERRPGVLAGACDSWTKGSTANPRIAQAAVKIALHRDPVDRFLAATAQILDMTSVTADEKLLGLGTI